MKKILLLDGGMGQTLVMRSHRPVTPLWSADVMLNESHLVEDLHLEYIQAGAKVITLNTYTATPERLKKAGWEDKIHDIHQAALLAAQNAVKRSGQGDVRIAGCLPPLVASFDHTVVPPEDDCLAQYKEMADLQKGADFYLAETLSTTREARAAIQAAKTTQKEVWVSFTLDDSQALALRSGEGLRQAIDDILPLKPDAVLLNCSTPETIGHAVHEFTGKLPVRFGAYANAFEEVDSLKPGMTVSHLKERHDLTPEAYADIAMAWIDAGIDIIGGCCVTEPAHIAAIAAHMNAGRAA